MNWAGTPDCAAAGDYQIRASNKAGFDERSFSAIFAAPPTLNGVAPGAIAATSSQEVVVDGTNLPSGGPSGTYEVLKNTPLGPAPTNVTVTPVDEGSSCRVRLRINASSESASTTTSYRLRVSTASPSARGTTPRTGTPR